MTPEECFYESKQEYLDSLSADDVGVCQGWKNFFGSCQYPDDHWNWCNKGSPFVDDALITDYINKLDTDATQKKQRDEGLAALDAAWPDTNKIKCDCLCR